MSVKVIPVMAWGIKEEIYSQSKSWKIKLLVRMKLGIKDQELFSVSQKFLT